MNSNSYLFEFDVYYVLNVSFSAKGALSMPLNPNGVGQEDGGGVAAMAISAPPLPSNTIVPPPPTKVCNYS